jgi:hypothetical protein
MGELRDQPQAWRDPIAAGRLDCFRRQCGAPVVQRIDDVGQANMVPPDLARQFGDGEPVQAVEMFSATLQPQRRERVESELRARAAVGY